MIAKKQLPRVQALEIDIPTDASWRLVASIGPSFNSLMSAASGGCQLLKTLKLRWQQTRPETISAASDAPQLLPPHWLPPREISSVGTQGGACEHEQPDGDALGLWQEQEDPGKATGGAAQGSDQPIHLKDCVRGLQLRELPVLRDSDRLGNRREQLFTRADGPECRS